MGSGLYPYQSLDASVDSIRLLKFDEVSGDESDSDELSCQLIHSTFASRPKYDALSYTWGSPEPVKTIKIDGHEVKIRENLYWALINVRNVVVQPLLWVDAISINQNDIEERNRQVSLMAFIYSRAQAVLAWLGRPIFSPFEMQRYQMRYEPELVFKLSYADYWKRVWIVQEIGLAKKVAFVYEFCKAPVTTEWDYFMNTLEERASRENEGPETMLPLKLKKHREGRHGDMNRLEQLLNTFMSAECQDLRDKIYGFLGLAHDCQNGSLKVDYSMSLLDLYREVIEFQYSARPIESPLPPEIDRMMRLVSFSNLVQRMFEGKVDIEMRSIAESVKLNNPLISPRFIYTVRGIVQGCVIHLGPSYGETVSSFSAEKIWKASFEHYYDNAADLVRLRKQDDSYSTYLVDMTDTDVDKICSFGREVSLSGSNTTRYDLDWLTNNPCEKPNNPTTHPLQRVANIPPLIGRHNLQEPRRFLGSNCFMGLAPAGVKLGDQIIRFWGCDVAAILRNESSSADKGLHIVGRADVSTPWQETEQESTCIDVKGNLSSGGVVEVELDLHDLQMLTR